MAAPERSIGSPHAGLRFARVRDESGRVRVAVGADAELTLLDADDLVAVLAADAVPEAVGTVTALSADSLQLPEPWELLVPVLAPETWAAGVTYEISRDARMQESELADVYQRVYDAERPELFLKDSAGRRTVGPGGAIAVRSDATWTVPEPEIALVLGAGGTPLGVTIGNDVSSRDIEGANPLYLPQAKVYAGACALGPAVLVPLDWDAPFDIEIRILDPGGEPVFAGSTSTARMCRSYSELIVFAVRDNPLPAGTVLLTGTGLVPPDDVTLAPGQIVEIHVPGIGTLSNPVAPPGGLPSNDTEE